MQMLTIEENQLQEQNSKLLKDNEELNNENMDMENKIKILIQRIKVHNLLKDIDIEEMKLLARNNKEMKRAFEDMITKWEAIIS